MKEAKLRFGFSAIQAGQKSSTVNALPKLVANSTLGKFMITAPVSKAMGIAVGDNIAFGNNIADLERHIAEQSDDMMAYCAENNIDITTKEGVEAIMEALTVWAIYKGVPMYAKGVAVMAKERYTKEDKQKFIDAHAAELLAKNRDELIKRNGGEDADDETLIALISVDDIEVPEYHVNSGSKTATTSNATGIGCQLNFTDTSIWNSLKADLVPEERTKKNRIFNVLLDESFKTVVDDGTENGAEVTCYPIEFEKDEDLIQRNVKDDDNDE